ncbi:hypothetical protein [Enterococcus faecium]|nr:hypothetical protein [Enterococcus faecium]
MPKSAFYIERYDDVRRIINLGKQYMEGNQGQHQRRKAARLPLAE